MNSSPKFSVDALKQAHEASAHLVRRTPTMSVASIGERFGGPVMLKAECLQRTGSFKLRGALNKVRTIASQTAGVVAGSAGNHGQALAYAARAHGVPCEVWMPCAAAVSKVEAVRAFGAVVHQEGDSVDDCVSTARAHAEANGLDLVHPFDDHDVIAGQAGLGLELLEDISDLAQVVVPIGGGGLASGVALAIKQLRPEVRIVGVQAARCAAFRESVARGEITTVTSAMTIADGIAIKRPGVLTMGLLSKLLDDLVTVEEEQIADAVVLLLERSKLLAEGAGAVSIAAALSQIVTRPPTGATALIVSGGNIDVGLLGSIAARHETTAGRRIRIFTRVADQPGGLADLLGLVAGFGANLLAVEHVRDGVYLSVRETGVEMTVETRTVEDGSRLLHELRGSGYDLTQVG